MLQGLPKNSQELFKKRDQTKLLTDVIEDRKGSTWKNGNLKLETVCIWTRQQEGRKEHGRETCTSALKNQWTLRNSQMVREESSKAESELDIKSRAQ